MRAGIKLIGVFGVLGAATLGGAMFWPIGAETASIALQGDVQRGAYLARVSGCISCHSDFENGGAPLAGGAGLSTDFGTFYPPNLTTDKTHGIGDWTVEEFAKAIRQGISPEGEAYYPAFSYPFYADMTDQDIADLWAAFQTVPPVSEPAPDHDETWAWGSAAGVWPDTPDRVLVVMWGDQRRNALAIAILFGSIQVLRMRCYSIATLASIVALLPCGPLYIMVGLAAVSGSPIAGAEFTMAFALGTVPLLWLSLQPLAHWRQRLSPTGLATMRGTIAFVSAAIIAWRLQGTLPFGEAQAATTCPLCP